MWVAVLSVDSMYYEGNWVNAKNSYIKFNFIADVIALNMVSIRHLSKIFSFFPLWYNKLFNYNVTLFIYFLENWVLLQKFTVILFD